MSFDLDNATGNILVLGGTGFVGRSVCEALASRTGAAGPHLVVPSRHPARAQDIRSLPTVDMVHADLGDDAALARLVSGCGAVVNLVAQLHGNEADFRRLHVELPRRLAAACARAGVRRLVHVSALGAAADAPSRYLRSKHGGEEALRAAAALQTTILRPSVVFGEHDRFMNLFASLQRFAPVMPLACAEARFQPVWVEDVATAVVRALEMPSSAGETIECTGPDVYTLGELVRLAARWAGHERPVLALPPALGRLQAAVLEHLPGPLMSRDNLDSMQRPSVASGALPGLSRFDIVPAALDAVMRPVLAGLVGPARFNPLRQTAGRY